MEKNLSFSALVSSSSSFFSVNMASEILRRVISCPWAMVAMGLVPSESKMVAEFQSTVFRLPSRCLMMISTDSHRSPARVLRIIAIELSTRSAGKSISSDFPRTSDSMSPVRYSKALLNRMILKPGSQTMIGALA